MIAAKSKPPRRRSPSKARATPKHWRKGPVSERPRQTQGTSFVLLSFLFFSRPPGGVSSCASARHARERRICEILRACGAQDDRRPHFEKRNVRKKRDPMLARQTSGEALCASAFLVQG